MPLSNKELRENWYIARKNAKSASDKGIADYWLSVLSQELQAHDTAIIEQLQKSVVNLDNYVDDTSAEIRIRNFNIGLNTAIALLKSNDSKINI